MCIMSLNMTFLSFNLVLLVVPVHRCEGLMLPPAQGQSLRSYLSSQDFHTCANLDKGLGYTTLWKGEFCSVLFMQYSLRSSTFLRDKFNDFT